jgi:hypothetical protein
MPLCNIKVVSVGGDVVTMDSFLFFSIILKHPPKIIKILLNAGWILVGRFPQAQIGLSLVWAAVPGYNSAL